MKELWSRNFSAMGSECAIYLFSDSEPTADEIADAAVCEVLRIDAKYSRYRPDSEQPAINRAAEQNGTLDVDEETAGLFDYAFACYRQSGGLFDISSGLRCRRGMRTKTHYAGVAGTGPQHLPCAWNRISQTYSFVFIEH